MFLGLLSKEDQVVFLKMAKHMAMVDDGIIDDMERAILSNMGKEVGVSLLFDEDSKPKRVNDVSINDLIFDFKDLSNSFKDEKSKNICIVELIGVGYANKDFHANQNELIQDISKSIGVSKSKIDEIEGWVVEMLKLSEKGEKVILG